MVKVKPERQRDLGSGRSNSPPVPGSPKLKLAAAYDISSRGEYRCHREIQVGRALPLVDLTPIQSSLNSINPIPNSGSIHLPGRARHRE